VIRENDENTLPGSFRFRFLSIRILGTAPHQNPIIIRKIRFRESIFFEQKHGHRKGFPVDCDKEFFRPGGSAKEMYETFYRFHTEPFRLSPDPSFCFRHKSYARAKAYMQYAFNRAEGFVMVTGRPGTGKTTLIGDLVKSLPRSLVTVATLVTTQLEAEDLLHMVAHAFGAGVPLGSGKASTLQYLTTMLRREGERGRRALLIIDEAQDLSASALEELRLLTNLQQNNQPLLQIFLVGQDNLRDLVHAAEMEQVFQRIVAACHLEPLGQEETREYVRHRLLHSGWQGDPRLSESLYPIIHRFSEGVPRRINLVCGRLLLHGAVERKHRIGVADARVVISELHAERLSSLSPMADNMFDVPDRFEEEQFSPTPHMAPAAEEGKAEPEGAGEAPVEEARKNETVCSGEASSSAVPGSFTPPAPPPSPMADGCHEREQPFFPPPEKDAKWEGRHGWLWLLALLLAGLLVAWHQGLLG